MDNGEAASVEGPVILGMRLVMIGPPGSGKGVQCELLAERFGIVHVSVGALLREQIKKGTADGREAERYVRSGRLAPTALVVKILHARLKRKDVGRGFVLDGFPRSIDQAEAFEAAVDHVFYLSIPPSVIRKRIAGRRQCGTCGHIEMEQDKCGKCGGRLVVRADDRPAVVEKRIKVFKESIGPVVRFYEKRGLLRRIDGTKTIGQVHRAIVAVLSR